MNRHEQGNEVDVVVTSGTLDSLPEVLMLSDQNKKTLGMIPYAAIEHHARIGELLVVHVGRQFAGYLLFRSVPSYGRLSITQLCIAEGFTGRSFTRLLIGALKEKCREVVFDGISLNCRHDYENARHVWARNQFVPVSEKNGRGKGNYRIVRWWWSNPDAPDLFGSYRGSVEKINAVIDVNALINLRENEKSAELLLSDWLVEEVELSITKETHVELLRHSDPSTRQRMRTFANAFPTLEVNEKSFEQTYQNLLNLLPSCGSEQDVSDRRQLAHASCCRADAFITFDKKILENAELLLHKFGLHLFRPEEFLIYVDERIRESAYRPFRLAGTGIRQRKFRSTDLDQMERKFRNNQEKKPEFRALVRNLCAELEVAELSVIESPEGQLLAAFAFRIREIEVEVSLVRVEAGALSFTLMTQILKLIVDFARDAKCEYIYISDKHNPLTSILLRIFGFFRYEEGHVKILKYKLLTHLEMGGLLKKNISLRGKDVQLRTLLPNENDQPLELEKALWPIKATNLQVPIYVVPIQACWAMQLFDQELASEDLFGADPFLAFSYENAYYTATTQRIRGPGRIVWYVSQDPQYPLSGCIRALSYLDQVSRGTAKELFKTYRRLGVYAWDDVFSKAGNDHRRLLQALLFSRTELLKNPVSLSEFNKMQLGLGQKKNNLPGPLKIDTDLFDQICRRL